MFALTGVAASGHELEFGTLRIQHPWVVAKDATSTTTTAYVIEIQNHGKEGDQLIGASLLGVEGTLQEAVAESHPAKFTPPLHGLEIAPGRFARLQPGVARIQFDGLHDELKEGQMVKGTLKFEKAGTMQVEFMIEPASLAEEDPLPPHHHHAHN
jgi:copper(I)-binding protein